MRFWTWAEIKTKVQNDLDLAEELFITADELLAYGNEAVDEAEAEIHTIYEDYFLTKSTLTMVSGEGEIALPSNIYAHKIRGLIYRNGNTWYPVKRIRDWKKFEEYTSDVVNSSTADYKYLLLNTTAGSPKVLLSPVARESGAYLTMWHLRNANRFTTNSDVCDIPEFVSFVIQYIKVRCYEKELHPNTDKAVAILQQQRELMKETLSTMVPDADNTIEMDLSSYEEQV
jgi:hypothetical protein